MLKILKFELLYNKEDEERIKQLLDVFINECKIEYNKQFQKIKGIINKLPATMRPAVLPEFPLEMVYMSDKDKIILNVTSALPPIAKKRAIKKMCKNLEGFFKSNNLKVKVNFLGEG